MDVSRPILGLQRRFKLQNCSGDSKGFIAELAMCSLYSYKNYSSYSKTFCSCSLFHMNKNWPHRALFTLLQCKLLAGVKPSRLVISSELLLFASKLKQFSLNIGMASYQLLIAHCTNSVGAITLCNSGCRLPANHQPLVVCCIRVHKAG
jgi:hypothetical protein